MAGSQFQLNAEVKGGGAVVWSLPYGNGTITNTGLFTAPAAPLQSHIATVRATNAVDPTIYREIQIPLTEPGVVTLTQSATGVVPGGKVTFSAKTTNSHDGITWDVRAQDTTKYPGTVSNKGVYTAPSSLDYDESYRGVFVRATNANHSEFYKEGFVKVEYPPSPGNLDAPTSSWPDTTWTATYDATGWVGGGWGTDPAKFWSISGNGTIIATWYDWSYGYPCVKFKTGGIGTATLTAHPTNEVGGITVSRDIQIVAIPDVSGNYSNGTSVLSVLDFGIKTVIRPDGQSAVMHRVWTCPGGQWAGRQLIGSGISTIYYGNSDWSASSINAYFAPDGLSLANAPSYKRTADVIIGAEPASTVEDGSTVFGPSIVYLQTGQTVQLQAAVGGTTNKGVSWYCPAGSGTVSSTGLYTAPSSPGTYQVTVTAQAAPNPSYNLTIRVGSQASIPASAVTGTFSSPVTFVDDNSTGQSNISLFSDGTKVYLRGGDTKTPLFRSNGQIRGCSYADTNRTRAVFNPQSDGTFVPIINYIYSYYQWWNGWVTGDVAFDRATRTNAVAVELIPNDPALLKLNVGDQMNFSALVLGSSNTGVTWNPGPQPGNLAINGNLATLTGDTTGLGVLNGVPTLTLGITSLADPTKTASVQVGIYSKPLMVNQLTPVSATTNATNPGFNPPIQFTAIFPSQPTNDAVWNILEGSAGGTVSRTGLYTPGTTLGVFHVVATSAWDATQTLQSTLTVTEPSPRANLSTSSGLVNPGQPLVVSWTGVWALNAPNPNLALTVKDTVTGVSQTFDVTGLSSYTLNPFHSTSLTLTITSATGMVGTATAFVGMNITQSASIYLNPTPVPYNGTFYATTFFAPGVSAQLQLANGANWINLGSISSGWAVPVDTKALLGGPVPTVNLRALLSDLAGDTGQVNATAPMCSKILSFTATPPRLLTGSAQPVTLAWSLDTLGRYATVQIYTYTSSGTLGNLIYQGDTISNTSSFIVHPTETTTYELQVTTQDASGTVIGTEIQDLVVKVGPVASVTLAPATLTLAPGASATLTASISALPDQDGLIWTCTGGYISANGSSGIYTAPLTTGSYQVTVTSAVDSSLSATTLVTVAQENGGGTGTGLAISNFTAGPSPQGAGHQLLTWTVTGATSVSLRDSNGPAVDVTSLTSMDVVPSGTTIYTLTASDGTNSVCRTLTIPGTGYAVAVVPTQVTMFTGVSYKFGYSIYAPSNQVTWTCDGGTIAADGTFTAPSIAGIYTVTAALVDDPTKTSSATVTVNDVSLMITPSYLTLTTGQSFSFGYQAFTYSDDRPTWSASAGSITSSGVFTAPLAPGTVTITLTSSKDTTKTAIATVEVKSIDLTILPSVLWVPPQGQYQLAAGTSLGPVNWSVVEANGGSIDASGIYTAPNEVGTFTIKATSAMDSSRFATATAIVATSGGGNWGPGSGGGGTFSPQNYGVSVEPAMSTVDAGTYQALRATVLGNDDQSVAWEVAGGTIQAAVDDQGVFTAHEPGIYTVVATSKVNSALQGSALLVVESSVKGLRNVPAELDLEGYSVTVLKDGKVLLVGGQDTRVIDTDPAKGYRGTAYLYDPVTKVFAATGSLIQARAGHMATLLADGRVLIAGGMGYFKWPTDPNAVIQEQPVKWGEIYNPATGQFEALPPPPDHPLYPAGSMRSAHGSTGQAATLFNGQVLMVGGPSGVQTYWPFDLFDPTTNLFDLTDIVTGNIANQEVFQTREGGAVVALDDGRALLTGGGRTYSVNETYPCGISSCVLNEARIFDPQSPSALSTVTGMTQARTGHTMTKLPNGKILIIGGSDHFTIASTSIFLPNPTATAEIYDPATGTFTPTGAMKWARSDHAAILLPTGQVMVAGGYLSATWDGTGTIWSYPTETELYDPDTGAFSVMDKLAFGLDRPKLALMQDGDVFVGGKPIVTATAGTPAAGLMAPGKKGVQSVIAPQTLTGSSGLQEAVFGTARIDPNLQIVAAYPEVFSKVKTSAGRHIRSDQDYGLRWSFTTIAPPYSAGELVNAISIPKGNSVALVPRDGQYIPSADAEDYTSTNHHARYYILKVRRRKGTWLNLNLKIDMTIGNVIRTISPFFQGYSLPEQVLGPTDPIVDVDTHPHVHTAGDTYSSVGGPTQPYIQQIGRYDILQYSASLKRNVPTGLEFVYYKIPVTFHSANPSPVSWDETLGGEPPGDLCAYSFSLTGVYIPAGGTILQSSISKADCRPPNVKVCQVALWPLPRAAWDAFGRAGARVCMRGDYWVSLDTFRKLKAQALTDPSLRWPWLQALVDAPGIPDGLLNDITYEHGGGHNGEHFSGNEIDMPPPLLGFNDADARGKFFYDLLISDNIDHFIYCNDIASRNVFFNNTANISSHWQTEINNNIPNWRTKWKASGGHAPDNHIHISLSTDNSHGL
jgi:hypothetical protein